MTRIRRTDNVHKFHEIVDDYQLQGYSVKEYTERHAKLKKRSYGSGFVHFLWFFFTFWWTFGIGNAIYAWYAYVSNSQTIIVKLNNN